MKKFLAACLLLAACSGSKNQPSIPTPPPASNFAKGADISWVTEMEAAGIKFYNTLGSQQECMSLLKSLGMNTIRLRVWVNPSNGWCNEADVITKAVRAKNLGMRLLIDFHYSDSWADPGKQNKPAAWTSLSTAQMQTAIYNHTFQVLTQLKNQGIVPEWVQVGNETNDGMLWPEGKASVNMVNYALFFKAGYNAVKAVDANIKVMVHLSNGFDNGLYRWNLDGLKNNGASWDVIGMSLYPSASNYSNLNVQCLNNMNDMVSRYNSEIMVCEVGMPASEATACRDFITDLIAKVKQVNNNKGIGVLYWEPQAYNLWQGYGLGAFDVSGKPTVALNAFQ
jgi:arabinogalactan endo-1,4-beta-galactosidase